MAKDAGDAGNGLPAAEPGATPVAELGYADAARELDEIVVFFEQREVDVDQLVARLQRATAIVDELDRRLRRTRMQVEELVPRLEAVADAELADDGLADDEADDEADPFDDELPLDEEDQSGQALF